jgi:hypothetical protein
MAEPATETLPEEISPEVEVDEEETVATARSPFDEPITERPGVDEEPDLENDDEAYLIEEPAEAPVDDSVEEQVYASSSIVVPAVDEPEATAAQVAPASATSPFSYALDDEKPTKPSGRFFPMALMILLGGVLGFAALWFWQQYNPPPTVPVITEMKSNNVPLTEFEESRRLVDSDPARYLAANAASPQDSEDHYLLGRAQILTGRYVEAKRQFELAKERLGNVEAANVKTMTAEIALGLAIADNPAVAEAFAREIAAANQPGNVANSNANSNSTSNIARPVR